MNNREGLQEFPFAIAALAGGSIAVELP
ncbi:MAG: hypothetical protein JWP16_1997, partial [Alphaproteobacteria bacterium]|nr:hypothetical protein [Alphaproteobacteria bacterium]